MGAARRARCAARGARPLTRPRRALILSRLGRNRAPDLPAAGAPAWSGHPAKPGRVHLHRAGQSAFRPGGPAVNDSVLRPLVLEGTTKIVLLVPDGLGDLPDPA